MHRRRGAWFVAAFILLRCRGFLTPTSIQNCSDSPTTNYCQRGSTCIHIIDPPSTLADGRHHVIIALHEGAHEQHQHSDQIVPFHCPRDTINRMSWWNPVVCLRAHATPTTELLQPRMCNFGAAISLLDSDSNGPSTDSVSAACTGVNQVFRLLDTCVFATLPSPIVGAHVTLRHFNHLVVTFNIALPRTCMMWIAKRHTIGCNVGKCALHIHVH